MGASAPSDPLGTNSVGPMSDDTDDATATVELCCTPYDLSDPSAVVHTVVVGGRCSWS